VTGAAMRWRGRRRTRSKISPNNGAGTAGRPSPEPRGIDD
jgi:hypothetical protein